MSERPKVERVCKTCGDKRLVVAYKPPGDLCQRCARKRWGRWSMKP